MFRGAAGPRRPHAERAFQRRRDAQGDELELCDGDGRLCLARLAAAGGRQDVAVEALQLPREVRGRKPSNPMQGLTACVQLAQQPSISTLVSC